jgi:hypothetical protein
MIKIICGGKLYTIEQEPYEPIEDTYKRGWIIIKTNNSMKNNECYSNSIMMLNTEMRGMSY